MFLSAKKYLEDSAKSATSGADQLLTHTSRIMSTVKVYENCHICQAQISVLGNYLTSQNTCRMCCKLFCNSCIAKSSVNVPNHLLDISFQSKTAHVQPERQFLCLKRCMPRVVHACMQAFRNEITARFEDYLNIFLSDERAQHFFFCIPKESPEDTAYRKALRMIHIAGVVAGMSGYAMTYNAVKYAYYSSELVNILTEGNILGILTPLLESLKQCGLGFSGPTAVLRLYYLGCYHTLQAKVDTSRRSLLYEADKPGVIYPECPQAVLEYVNSYLSAAQWQYMSALPPPHQDNDWGSWYLSQIIRKQGWSLLMCINDSSKIPDGSKCPAFALVTRCFEAADGAVVKEAMLVIRGSKSIMDWSINLEEEMCDYSYTHIVSQGSPFLSTTTYSTSAGGAGKTSADGEFYTRTVNGTIHKGLHTAAMGLLEGYNLRSTLLRLLGLDYQVKVVGHSLGAGIAALIAAELRITLIAKHLHMYEHPTPEDSSAFAVAAAVASAAAASASASTKSTPLSGQKASAPNSPSSPLPAPFSVTRPATGTRVPAYLRQVVNSISAVVFSSPAFLTINLADAFLADRILINTVYDKDIIPRFSFKTIQIMAEELKDPDFCAQADLWTQQDKTDFSNYAISMGRAADIYQCGMAAAAAEAEEVAAEEEGLRGVAVPVAEALASDGSSTAAAPATMEVQSAAAPPKPSKPVRPEKVKTMSSTDSCASYATADGGDAGGGPSSSAKMGTYAGTTTTTTTAGTAAGIAATAVPAPSAAPTTSNNGNGTSSSSSLLGRGFSLNMSSLHSLAVTAIDRLNTMNNEAGASAEARQARAAAVAGQSDPNTVTPATATYADFFPVGTTKTAAAPGTAGVVQPVVVTPPKPKAHTVTPGPIVHLYKENDGTVHAAVVTHLHSAFQRMQIIPAHSADDHLMGSVREGMRSAFFQHQQSAHNVGNSPAYQNKKRPRGEFADGSSATQAEMEAEASAEVCGSAEDKERFEKYFDIPAAGVHYYYPASGRGPCPASHNVVSGVKANAATAVPVAAAAAAAPTATAASAGVSGSDNGAAFTGPMPPMPPKIYRSISADGATDSQTYTSCGTMLGAGTGVGVADTTAVEAHPSVLTATEVQAYEGDTTNAAAAASGGGETGNDNGTGGAGGKGTVVVGAAAIAEKKDGKVSSGVGKGTFSAQPTAFGGSYGGKVVGDKKKWVPCSVCGLDVTWPYVLHSDASRAIVAHNCRKCGEVVCSLCAPAGDSLPGDGLNQSYQLGDYRVSLPELGLFSPQRVCLLCYFDT